MISQVLQLLMNLDNDVARELLAKMAEMQEHGLTADKNLGFQDIVR